MICKLATGISFVNVSQDVSLSLMGQTKAAVSLLMRQSATCSVLGPNAAAGSGDFKVCRPTHTVLTHRQNFIGRDLSVSFRWRKAAAAATTTTPKVG